MGGLASTFHSLFPSELSNLVDREKSSWVKPHELQYRNDIRTSQLSLVDNFEGPLKLCYRKITRSGFEYQHWFVTDGTWTIEFGVGRGNILETAVTIHDNPLTPPYILDREFPLNEETKKRMKRVLGASNYSLALRNCEHVARYIQSGSWVSFQMVGTGALVKIFREHIQKEFTKTINHLPSPLKLEEPKLTKLYKTQKNVDPNNPEKKIVTRYPAHMEYLSMPKVLTQEDDDFYNIVFLGPTGSGKSTLINHLFNYTVMNTDDTADSVTRQVYFTQGQFASVQHTGKGEQAPPKSQTKYTRMVNVIDTVGMCDSVFSRKEVYDMVKHQIKANLFHLDKVVIVCSGRIETQHVEAIKQFMDWLQYPKYKQKFSFIYNKTDGQSEDKKNTNLQVMCEKLGVDTAQNVSVRVTDDGSLQAHIMTVAVGFPPNGRLADVKCDIKKLNSATLTNRHPNVRIPVKASETACVIL